MTQTHILKDKVAIISGSSRGIGAETAIALAKNGCHVVITGRTDKLTADHQSTIHSVATQCGQYGVQAIAVKFDIRNHADIDNVVSETVKKFGKIDILINAATETHFTQTSMINSYTFDLMQQVNVRGTFLMSQACLPFLKLSGNAHIINFSPPLTLNAQYFSQHSAYTISKYSMSMFTLAMAHDFYHDNIAVNSLWSRSMIQSETLLKLANGNLSEKSMRKPTIMADAVVQIVTKPSKVCTGCFLIDDLVLMGAGVTDFDQYAVDAGQALMANLFLPHDLPPLPKK
jgi:citronellol/citronellal dehydrogenase